MTDYDWLDSVRWEGRPGGQVTLPCCTRRSHDRSVSGLSLASQLRGGGQINGIAHSAGKASSRLSTWDYF